MPGHASFIVSDVEAEGMLIALDLVGVAASSGSACASGAATPSHVLTAMGFGQQAALGALRLTLGRESTAEGIDTVIETLPRIVQRLRGNG